ncbi:hypothetical protein D3C80_594930 [compost metagenome]
MNYSLLIKIAVVCFCVQLLSAVSRAQTKGLPYKIYSSAENKQLTIDELAAQLIKAQVIVFGEEHNDSVGHVLQLAVLEKLFLQSKGKVALSLEMFERDIQPVINEYLTNMIREKNFMNDARPWKNYADYKPLIEFAKKNTIPVIAANAPSRYVNRVTRLGLASLSELNDQSKTFLPPLPIDTLSGAYYHKFLKTLGGHNMPGMQIYQSQNLWDASMADVITSFIVKNKEFKVLQLNGRFHSDECLGVCYRLKKAGLKVTTISCFSDDSFKNPDFTKFSQLADFIIVTDASVKRTF